MTETEVVLKQHTMIDVAVADGERPTCIFERLFNVYGKATMGMGKTD
jgi:hypothetical protein